jgi:hypothetical protein
MTETLPQPIGAQLRRVLRKVAEGDFPQGSYSPAENLRDLSLGTDHTSKVSQMVAWHEAYHAILNGSTTFGNAMILASALDAAGDSGFAELVERMIVDAKVTHETYATVASLYSTAAGSFDALLLADYGPYLSLFRTFDRYYALNDVPHVGSLCIDSAARAAMQTSVIYKFIETDCSEWAAIAWDERSRPDVRFSVFLRSENAERLRSAVTQAMEAGPEPLRLIVVDRISGNEALDLVRSVSVADQDRLSEIAFATASTILSENFDEQRAVARRACQKIEAYAGARLKTHFHVPEDLQQDRDAIVSDFRREKLTISRTGQAPASSHATPATNSF